MPNKYIQSLDGVRAFAVIAVILFHALPNAAPGGFIGVDIFFVISGYVITKKIFHEINEQSFTFAGFYLGRAKRLLPLLILVSLFTAVASTMIAPPKQIMEFARSLVATQLYVSNIYFWRTLGYFEAGDSFQPLLHTWSLSVEEQFYLLFPLFLVFVINRYSRLTSIIIATLIVLSVLFSELTLRHHTNVSFYLIPSRGFELLMGALLFIAHDRYKGSVGQFSKFAAFRVLGVASLVILLLQIAFNFFGEPFPGFNALWISLCSAIVIHDCATSGMLDKIFSLRILRHLGYISYGLYLWHLPLLEILKQVDLSGYSEYGSILLAVLLTYVFAVVSGKYIERPIWKKSLSVPIVVSMALTPILLSIIFAVSTETTHGFRNRFLTRLDENSKYNYGLIETYANSDNLQHFHNSNPCSFIGEFSEELAARILECSKLSQPILVFGDSHAMNLYNALADTDKTDSVIAIANGGCALGNEARKCDMDKIIHFINENKHHFLRILYTEAGFRLFKTTHGVQSERQNFISSSAIESLHPDVRKIDEIASSLRNNFFDVPFFWVGAWTEPHFDLYSKQSINQLKHLSLSKTYLQFEKLDLLSTNSMHNAGMESHYISSNKILHLNEATSLVRGICLMYSDSDHLSSCGELLLGSALISVVGATGTSEKQGDL